MCQVRMPEGEMCRWTRLSAGSAAREDRTSGGDAMGQPEDVGALVGISARPEAGDATPPAFSIA